MFEVAARLARALRPVLGQHQRECRCQRHAPDVSAFEYSSEARGSRPALEGIVTCKSRLCPYCMIRWQRTRASEIRRAIDFWNLGGKRRVFFLTFTMRHNKGLALSLMRRLLTKAFGLLWTGRSGKKFCASLGGKPETIRADDDTFSFECRWHPHGHCLIFFHVDGLQAEKLEALFAERWPEVLTGALESFQKAIEGILQGERCAIWKRHGRRVGRIYDGAHSALCSPSDDDVTRQVHSTYVRTRPGPARPAVEVIADDRAGVHTARGELLDLLRARGTGSGAVGFTGRAARAWHAIEWRANYDAGKPRKVPPAFCCADRARLVDEGPFAHHANAELASISPSLHVKRVRRVCDREREVLQCRPEHETDDLEELEERLRDEGRLRWTYIDGAPQCWECERGKECRYLRARLRKMFGVRLVREHVPLRDAARNIEKKLRRFSKKAIQPNRRRGVIVENIRDGDKLDAYLTKLGAMGFELAMGSSKVGKLGSDGLMHYSPIELAHMAATPGEPRKVAARSAYGELFTATHGLQTITFSSRARLGLGPDPYGDGAEPAEQEPDETKRFLGTIKGSVYDELTKRHEELAEAGEGVPFVVEIVRLHREWRLESADFLEPPLDEEHGRPVRVTPACNRPVVPGPSYWWGRHQVETEISHRVVERAQQRSNDREAAARLAQAADGQGVPEDTEFRRRAALRASFEEMRRRALTE